MKTKEDLQELIGLIYDLNKESKYDWFFSFSGHVDAVSVYYTEKDKCGECGSQTKESFYLTHQTALKHLKQFIEEVRGYLK